MGILKTSLELNEHLLNEAISLSPKIQTKKGIIELALIEFVEKRKKKDLKDIKGSIEFLEDYDYKAMREKGAIL